MTVNANVLYLPMKLLMKYTNTTDINKAERNHEPGNVVANNKSFKNSIAPIGKPSLIYDILDMTNQESMTNQLKYNRPILLQYGIKYLPPPCF